MDADKVAKIRVLAERGATEGERAAARAALERLGEPLEAPPTGGGGPFVFVSPPVDPKVKSFIDMMMGDFKKQFAGMSSEDIIDYLDRIAPKKSTQPHHHGRVHFDSE